MAAFTTFAAGFSMTLSSLTAFRQMGQFLMTISRWCGACCSSMLIGLRLQCSRHGFLPRSSSCHSAPSSVRWASAVRYPSHGLLVASSNAAVVMVPVQGDTLAHRTAAPSCPRSSHNRSRQETSTCRLHSLPIQGMKSSLILPSSLLFFSLSLHTSFLLIRSSVR